MIKARLEQLRKIMQQKGIQAYYINGSDPHLSEYLPQRWQTRAFISGFTGSLGWLAITMNEAALWTDSRYFLQAEDQLAGTGIQLMKLRQPETPDVINWLISKLPVNSKVGINPECISYSLYKKMKNELAAHQIGISKTGDLLNEIWENRPDVPNNEIYQLDIKYTGESRKEKITRIRKELERKNADLHILTALDDIAWTFNLRGNDIEFNPVFLSYALIDKKRVLLFTNPGSISSELNNQLISDGIQVYKYDAIFCFLKEIKPGTTVYLDSGKTNYLIISTLPSTCTIKDGLTIPCQLKAQKNTTEINCIKNAMQKDGVAMVEFLYWLENTIKKQHLTEYDIAVKLSEFRKKQKHYKGDSFFPIVGYNEHGAIVHFHVERANALTVKDNGLLLFDSGAHYLDGTTDITRTIALGIPSSQQKTDYTLVLKGMIALSQAVFPEYTCGHHLDILARKALWSHGLNYGHGTGHGIGFFLNVHEGPMSIRMDYNKETIKEGQVISNEPGVYKTGEYGIRTENMMVCIEKANTEYGRFLGFETLTLCPIDTQLIDIKLLSESEIQWINNYHETVFEKLSPFLNTELKKFLIKKTQHI